MSKELTLDDYEQQRLFFLNVLKDIYLALPEEDKEKMNSLNDSAYHCAPEITFRMWSKLFNTLSYHFHETAPDGKHAEVVNIYNSKYKEFRDKWYNDNTV